MKTPHLLLAAGNCHKLRTNLAGILDRAALSAIDAEIERNARGMFALGRLHLAFAKSLKPADWRHKVSRLYYAAYHLSRSVRFVVRGDFSQEVQDHKKIEHLPDKFTNRATYENRLSVLRDDRNMCDYDHTAVEADLVIPIAEAEALVEQLIVDAASYLKTERGLSV